MRLILLLLAFGIAACDRQKPQAPQGEEAAVPGEVKGASRDQAGKPAPDVTFTDPDGEETSLADFRGRPVLVNLWASWCAPCIKELPTLVALGERKGAPQVLTISQDMAPQGSVRAFIADRGLKGVEAWHDDKMVLGAALGVQIMPTSVLYDAEGKEVWRYTGDLDWTGEEAARLLAEAGPGKA